MSDLRYFADLMHEQIKLERELVKLERELERIKTNALTYATSCEAVKTANSPAAHRGRFAPAYHQAIEGQNAVRIIFEGPRV